MDQDRERWGARTGRKNRCLSPLDTHPHVATHPGSTLETAQNVMLKVVEFALFFQLQVARAVKRYLHVFHDRTWMRTHDENPVRQIDSLFHIVGNKQNCTRCFIPYLEQKLLHFTAGLRIQSAERL